MASLERVEHLAVVTMHRPPHNLINGAFIDALMQALSEAVEGGARAALLKSGLKHFSAGADMEVFRQTPGEGEGDAGRTPGTGDFLGFMRELPIPAVACVHGAALGGGFEIALACDLIVAAKSARLGAVEVSLGICPLMGAVQRLVERVGAARAKEFAMLGRRHDPQTLEALGVINLAVDDNELDAVAISYAQQLANGPTVALRAIKQLADIAAERGVAAADEAMSELVRPVLGSDDARRGVKAFQSAGPGTAIFEGR